MIPSAVGERQMLPMHTNNNFLVIFKKAEKVVRQVLLDGSSPAEDDSAESVGDTAKVVSVWIRRQQEPWVRESVLAHELDRV